MAHAVLDRQIAQALVSGALGDLRPVVARQPRAMLRRAGPWCLHHGMRIEEGDERRGDHVYLAYWTPVTSARSNRSLDDSSAGGFLFPTYFPIARRAGTPTAPQADRRDICPCPPRPRPQQHTPKLDHALWPRIAERARHESLRDLAAEYGVSHETIRTIVRRAHGGAAGPVAAD